MNAFLTALNETYIAPFANLRRCISYFGVFLGVFGFNLILIAIPLGYTSGGYTAMLVFYASFFAAMGLVFFPLFYICYSTLDGKAWRIVLIAVQVAGFFPLFFAHKHLYHTGILCGLISTIFWGMYHIAMRDNTSPGKRGFQVVLGDNLTIISAALAALVAVHFTGAAFRNLLLIYACFAMFLSNLCQSVVSPVLRDMPLRDFGRKILVTSHAHQGLMLRILQRSFLATPDYILPAVLYFMHYSVASIGAFILIRTVIQTFLSPLIATMIQRRSLNEYLIGIVFSALGWVIFYLDNDSRIALMTFIILNATGLRITNNSITVRLYAIDNYSGLMMNEMFLGASRTALLAVLIPVLFWNSKIYILLMTALALVILGLEMIVKGTQQILPKRSV